RMKTLASSWSGLLSENLAQSTQFISSRTLLCWLWFFIGVLWHSRLSALMALTGIALCVGGSFWLPSFGDPAFAMNAVVIFLALGGHYLRLNAKTFAWTMLITTVLALLHAPLSEALLRLGLLPLCLPFNLALLGSLALLKRERIPIDWAACTPAQIRAFLAQKEVADACWKKLQQAAPAVQTPTTANLPRPVMKPASDSLRG
ncbi:MAG: urea transporter, partial [Verrucomicrobiaceae bacterium]|nr:urea transporter [Verrucomicrobiaceae bacterium]